MVANRTREMRLSGMTRGKKSVRARQALELTTAGMK